MPHQPLRCTIDEIHGDVEREQRNPRAALHAPRAAPHAPQAGFGDQDFYPDLIDKAAVLTCHLAWNHPLPDGNKRAGWACLVMFLDLNGVVWDPEPPDVDEAEVAVLSVAAKNPSQAR